MIWTTFRTKPDTNYAYKMQILMVRRKAKKSWQLVYLNYYKKALKS